MEKQHQAADCRMRQYETRLQQLQAGMQLSHRCFVGRLPTQRLSLCAWQFPDVTVCADVMEKATAVANVQRLADKAAEQLELERNQHTVALRMAAEQWDADRVNLVQKATSSLQRKIQTLHAELQVCIWSTSFTHQLV
jgi:hypothetical protein